MLKQKPEPKRMTFEEWLDFEDGTDERHEFHGGELVAMGRGSTRAHSDASIAFLTQLRAHLGTDGPCRVYNDTVAVRVESVDKAFYPDIHVTCDTRDLEQDERISRHPVLIVEVLSASTRDYDQGDKSEFYRALPSLHEYVVVDTRVQRVALFRRAGVAEWLLRDHYAEDVVRLESVGLELSVASLYAGTKVPAYPRPVPATPAALAEGDGEDG